MTQKMKAAIFAEYGGPEVIEISEIPIPDPGPGEVRIKVKATAMNHLDLWVRRGLPIETPMPHIGGSDIAGVVDAVGLGAENVPIGLRVVVDPSISYRWYDGLGQGDSFEPSPFQLIGEHTQGGLAEYAIAPAENLLELPELVSYERAAAAGLVFVTAWRALITQAKLQSGEKVLITGTSGGVGTAAVQIASRAGARVYAVTSGENNVARAEDLGADVVYDRLRVDFAHEVWRDTNKSGVNIVFDTVGEAVWEQCLRALALRGRLVNSGATTGSRGVTEIRLLFWKQLNIIGSTMGTPAEYRRVMRLVFEGVFDPVIHQVLPLEQARTAHEILESGELFGKLVLVP